MAGAPYKVRGDYKVGDIFEVRLQGNKKGYLQYIGKDATQIGSDVVRVFEKRYTTEANPAIEDIVSDKIEFYTHVVSAEFGMQDDSWVRVGNSNNIGDLKTAFFRDPGDQPVRKENGLYGLPNVSKTWYLWRMNEPRVFVKELTGENTKAYSGDATWPKNIVYRMQTGKYHAFYPDYK